MRKYYISRNRNESTWTVMAKNKIEAISKFIRNNPETDATKIQVASKLSDCKYWSGITIN